jgi:hypothetical protein
MRDTNHFFEEQAKECNGRSIAAENPADQEFWGQLAHRWEELVRAAQREHSEAKAGPRRQYRFGRTRFTYKTARA